jgi:hypothetical protein
LDEINKKIKSFEWKGDEGRKNLHIQKIFYKIKNRNEAEKHLKNWD